VKLTLIHPAIGRFAGDRRYIRSWQMEPLPTAVVAALTPRDVEVVFHDDRVEEIPFDAPTDLVALSVETYTATRSYQIASEYRRRGVPVILGGFHATLAPDEVARFGDAVVLGEAETLWPQVIDDFRHGRLEAVYRAAERPSLAGATPRREIFRGKRYLPVRLIETGRGCRFRCDFCAVQSYYGATYTRRPTDEILAEIQAQRRGARLFFFVDDNMTADLKQAKEFFRALAPLKIRWVSQASINAARDPELVELMARSGCRGLLIGFESLDPDALAAVNKAWNTAGGGYEEPLANLRRHRICIYATFLFGGDRDTPQSFRDALDFAREHAFYIAAFNHLTPFPGTPLYRRLEEEGRLLYHPWWRDPSYRYNRIPFQPKEMSAEEVQRRCIEARQEFYSLPSVARRFVDPVNRPDFFMLRNFWPINLMIRGEVHQRDALPLGDQDWRGSLLEVGSKVGEG